MRPSFIPFCSDTTHEVGVRYFRIPWTAASVACDLQATKTNPSRASGTSSGAGDPGPSHPLRARVEAFERTIIAEQFDAATRNQSETARRLGVSRPALIEKLHKYGLIER